MPGQPAEKTSYWASVRHQLPMRVSHDDDEGWWMEVVRNVPPVRNYPVGFSLSRSVFRLMPSIRAARVLLPPALARTF